MSHSLLDSDSIRETLSTRVSWLDLLTAMSSLSVFYLSSFDKFHNERSTLLTKESSREEKKTPYCCNGGSSSLRTCACLAPSRMRALPMPCCALCTRVPSGRICQHVGPDKGGNWLDTDKPRLGLGLSLSTLVRVCTLCS